MSIKFLVHTRNKIKVCALVCVWAVLTTSQTDIMCHVSNPWSDETSLHRVPELTMFVARLTDLSVILSYFTLYILIILLTPKLNHFLSLIQSILNNHLHIIQFLWPVTPLPASHMTLTAFWWMCHISPLCLVGQLAFYCLCLAFTKISTTGDTITSVGPLGDPSASAITPFCLNRCSVSKRNNTWCENKE